MDNSNWSTFSHAAVLVHAGSKHPIGKNWQHSVCTADDINAHIAGGGNLGLRANVYPSIDIDIKDASLRPIADRAAQLASAHCGEAPVRGRSDSPSRMMLYRASEYLPRNPTIEFRTHEGLIGKIELRAGLHQNVVHGVHPEGARYSWDREFHPWELATLQPGAWDVFRHAFLDYLQALGGCTVVSKGNTNSVEAPDRQPLGNPAHAAPSAADVMEALARQPNTHERFPNRGDIVHFMAAVKSALGHWADDYADKVIEWSAQYDGPNEFTWDQARAMWDSIHDSAHGWSYVDDITRGKTQLGVYIDPAQRLKFTGIHIDDLTDITEPDDFVEDFLCDGNRSVIFGQSNVGKSFIALDLCLHVGSSKTWCGKEVEGGGAAYFLGEGQRGMRLRVQAWLKRHNIPRPSGIRFELVETTGNLLDDAEVGLIVQSCMEIKQRLGSLRLVVIDTLACSMAGGDENSAQDMTRLLKAMGAIAEVTGAHVMIVHHGGKDQTKGARGHSSLRAAVDTELTVTRADKTAPLRLAITKQRDLEYAKDIWFELESEPLGINRRGKQVTGGVLKQTAAKVTEEKKLPPIQQDIFNVISSHDGISVADLKAKLYAYWRQAAPDIASNTLAERLKAVNRLQTGGYIKITDDCVSLRRDDFDDASE